MFSVLHWSTFMIVMAKHISPSVFEIVLTKNVLTVMHIVLM